MKRRSFLALASGLLVPDPDDLIRRVYSFVSAPGEELLDEAAEMLGMRRLPSRRFGILDFPPLKPLFGPVRVEVIFADGSSTVEVHS